MDPTPFLQFARKRHGIYIARSHDEPAPWTDDPVLHKYRFTNVFRELDAVTVWFREQVRDPLKDKPEVLLATVLFRWFNRITTGEAIFSQNTSQTTLRNGTLGTPWDHVVEDHDQKDLTSQLMNLIAVAVQAYCGKGPYVTGAYIIKTPDGYTKLDGVLQCVEWFMTQKHDWYHTNTNTQETYKFPADWYQAAGACLTWPGGVTLEGMWNWLRKFPYLGDFMAYEIVTDLRHTALLDKAPDIYTWANPGPGAMRGLNRLYGRDLNHRQPKHVFITEMRALLEDAEKSVIWPLNPSGFPVEMRDIEHTLCEFDKYERARLGQGKPRGVYPHG